MRSAASGFHFYTFSLVFRQRSLFFNNWGALDSGGLNSNYRMSVNQKEKIHLNSGKELGGKKHICKERSNIFFLAKKRGPARVNRNILKFEEFV